MSEERDDRRAVTRLKLDQLFMRPSAHDGMPLALSFGPGENHFRLKRVEHDAKSKKDKQTDSRGASETSPPSVFSRFWIDQLRQRSTLNVQRAIFNSQRSTL